MASDRIYQILEGMREHEQDENYRDLDPQALSKLSPKDLALWQRHQDTNSAQFILASHEWDRRLLAEQLRSIRFGVWATLIGTLAGSLGGVYLGYLLTSTQ